MQMLVDQDFRPGMVDAAINKAKNIPREIALRKVVKPKHSTRPVAVVSWESRGQSIPFCCRRKVYRWEISFSASGSVQPSFLSFPAYQISNITHDLTDN